MKSLQFSRSGPTLRVLLRPRFAFVAAVGGTLLVASLTLPSSFDETFETIANHGRPEKAPEEKKGTSALHVAIAGVVPKYDGKMEAGRWWGDAGVPLEEGAAENPQKAGQSSKRPSLLSIFRQQLAGAIFSASGDFSDQFSSIGNRDLKSSSPGIPNILAMNPFGDVQTLAATLPPSASFHSSGIPLRENIVPIEDGSGSANVPGPHTWNSYGSVPISASDSSLAVTSIPSAAPAVTTTPLSVPSPPVTDSSSFISSPARLSSLSTPIPVSSPMVQPIVSNVPAPAIAQTTLRLAKAPSVSPTLTQATYTPTAISSPVSASPTIPTTVLTSASSTGSANIGYQFVTVGNPGNANDPATGNQYGAVNYSYDIGKYDVTLTQYCAFLNAVAVTDSYGLYDTNMALDAHVAGISRSGPNGAYSYSVIGDGQRPVTYVTWFDAARFANWVNNGQPTGLGEVAGSTETGAYTLRGATTGVVSRNANAQVWIPTESEWYKAAYYDPTLNGGTGGYWSTAAQSNSQPGNTIGSLPNQANYLLNGIYSTGGAGNNYLTDVGAFNMSMSPYGTYDQMGDVYQWNDAIVGPNREYRGGAWNDFAYSDLLSTNALYADPTTFGPELGFRLAGIPEPAVWPSLLGGAGLLLARRRRRHAA